MLTTISAFISVPFSLKSNSTRSLNYVGLESSTSGPIKTGIFGVLHFYPGKKEANTAGHIHKSDTPNMEIMNAVGRDIH